VELIIKTKIFHLKKGTIYALLILTVSAITYQSCKKKEHELKINSSETLTNFLNKSGTSNLYTYNSSYNVLMFDSFEDLEALEDELTAKEDNFPFNRGKEAEIISTLNNIKTYGWTSQKTAPNNEVLIKPFKKLLSQSHPLSDEVLQYMLEIHDQVTPSFSTELIVPIFEENLPFSTDVLGSISDSNIPNVDKDNLETKDDQTTLVPSYTYNDFLRDIPGYNSLYASLENVEKLQLESGMDPSDALFDDDFVKFDIERLFLNVDKEVYLQGNLIKIYDSCRVAIFHNNIVQAYADLALLDPNGNVSIPNLTETSAGLTLNVMNQYVPQNMVILPYRDIPIEEDVETGVVTINVASVDAMLLNPDCPQSAFSFDRDSITNKGVYFDSYTALNYNGTSFNQYWDFGDGTGSFQTDPHHVYTNDGAYDVTLTTFNNDCGCWDETTMNVFIGSFYLKACDIEMASQNAILTGSVPGSYTYTFNFDVENNSSSTIQEVEIHFGDNSSQILTSSSTQYSVSHTYTNNSGLVVNFEPYVTVLLANNCPTGPIKFGLIGTQPSPESVCCDTKDSDQMTVTNMFNSSDLKMQIKDRVTGKYFLVFFGTYIKASHKFYRKRNSGNWRRQKANHSVSISGNYNLWENNTCGTEKQINGGTGNPVYKSKTNKKGIHLKFDSEGKFGMKSHDMISIYHTVTYNGSLDDYDSKFGDDCP